MAKENSILKTEKKYMKEIMLMEKKKEREYINMILKIWDWDIM